MMIIDNRRTALLTTHPRELPPEFKRIEKLPRDATYFWMTVSTIGWVGMLGYWLFK